MDCFNTSYENSALKGEVSVSLKFDTPRKETEIALVNDSPGLIQVYEKFFAMADLRIVAKFGNITEALSYFATDKSNPVILFDCKLSEPDNFEAARQLKHLNPNLKMILATPDDRSEISVEENRLFDGMVRKPFVISELIEVIQKATSPLRIKGSKIFENSEEIGRVLQDILADSKEKMCSVQSPAFVKQDMNFSGGVPSHIAARSRGLKVFLITEITRENLFFCKQLIVNQGIQVRHIDGLIANFAVWDEKHSIETIRIPANSFIPEQILYSNMENIVDKNQYEFNLLWASAIPGEQKIKELEEHFEEVKFSVLSGNDVVEQNRTDIVRNACSFVDACIIPGWLNYLLKPSLLKVGIEAISRGVRCRLLTEITRESLEPCKKLIEKGVEVRHLTGLKGAFALNEREVTVNAEAEEPTANRPFTTIYSNYLSFVEQHESIFNMLWQIAAPAPLIIRQIEEERQIENAS